jgi:WD40-like Beta Propeller Repeat
MKSNTIPLIFIVFTFSFCNSPKQFSLRDNLSQNLNLLVNKLITIQDMDSNSVTMGALYCESCSDYHKRASETVNGLKLLRNAQPSHPHPHFSPDGKSILFSSDKSGIPAVYSVRVNLYEKD